MRSDWKASRAFSLVELLCALLLGSAVIGAALAVLAGSIRSYEQVLALSEARRRGQMALQLFVYAIENAGLGIPGETVSFRDSLSVGTASLNSLLGWEGPVSTSGNELRLVYAVPTNLVNASLSTETLPSADRSVRLSGPVPEAQIQAWSGFGPTSTRSWVLFPPSEVPFLVRRVTNQTLIVRSSRPSWIASNARLHFLRALRARVISLPGQEPVLCTEDLTSGSGLQERVIGIVGFRPEYDPQTRTLTLAVLSRGGRRHPNSVSPTFLAGWPGRISDEDRCYVLAVSSRAWRIRNGGAP